MKIAVQIISYFLGGVMILGAISLANDASLDGYTLLGLMLVLAQVITTLIFINDK